MLMCVLSALLCPNWGYRLPDTVDGGVAGFLDHIPGTAVRGAAGAGDCSMTLPPLSVSFICHD